MGGYEKLFSEINPDDSKRPRWSDDAALELLAAIRAGNSAQQYIRLNPHMPSIDAYYWQRAHNPAFREADEQAREIGMETRITEALDNQYSVRTDKALSIAAQKYSEVALKAAAAMSPKRFGPMVRHAGHDGGALTVQVVRFSDLPSEQLTAIDAEYSEARAHILTDDGLNPDKSTD
jgi:hypothetical protein